MPNSDFQAQSRRSNSTFITPSALTLGLYLNLMQTWPCPEICCKPYNTLHSMNQRQSDIFTVDVRLHSWILHRYWKCFCILKLLGRRILNCWNPDGFNVFFFWLYLCTSLCFIILHGLRRRSSAVALSQDVVAGLHQLRADQDKTTQGAGESLKWDIEIRSEIRRVKQVLHLC